MKTKALATAGGHRAARHMPVRVQHSRPAEGAPAEEEQGSLLASRAFWVGGLFSVGVWAGVVYLVRHL